jgi:pimeloyl-ACP methyl ester carboxylesterase
LSRGIYKVLAALSFLPLAACQTPTQRADHYAQQAHFTRQIVDGSPYRHVVYRNLAFGSNEVLHVYIEGDGTPYTGRYTVAADPTPHHPLALHLMAEDSAPAVWVGRPCYFGLSADVTCRPSLWTLQRFSSEVVQSMATVINEEIARAHASRVVLIGHSGGAALAVLAAAQIDKAKRVITVAGNLDIEAWAALHAYTPLTGSLNPVQSRLQNSHITMVHYAGARDTNVPPAMILAASAQLGGEVIVEPTFDHECCWQTIWPEVLRRSAD